MIELFGIPFTNPMHRDYAIGSVGALVICFLWATVFFGWGRRRKRSDIAVFGAGVFAFPGMLHTFISLIAIDATEWGTVDAGLYTSDCIWWNAVMAALHAFFAAGLFLVAAMIKPRQEAPP